jgi:hypothetical protein
MWMRYLLGVGVPFASARVDDRLDVELDPAIGVGHRTPGLCRAWTVDSRAAMLP